jgi:vacuolar protein 8
LESEDKKLIEKIKDSGDLVGMVRNIAEKNVESDHEDDGEDGEAEVVSLAKRCAEVLGVGTGGPGGGKGLVEG